TIFSVINSIPFVEIIDIVLLTFLIYYLLKIIRETRAGQLLKGVVWIVIIYLICKTVGLKSMTFLLDNTLNIGLIAILIMFQPELRRALEKFGSTNMSKLPLFSFMSEQITTPIEKWQYAIDMICLSCEELSASTTGALFVLERNTKLDVQIKTGTIMNAIPSKELFGNIFYPKTPLHDGAVIMRDGVIHAAACFLPKPEREEFIDKKLGSRHRAAIGMSENSDAIIVVVSEETGTISVAENGVIKRDFDKNTLKEYLVNKMIPEPDSTPSTPKFNRLTLKTKFKYKYNKKEHQKDGKNN
ncbi:MAG: diadenylate cyclase CdaA, partial [Ruminococcus sp.]|nr:diadenylate cyclase CdaA [Ruminococcus sp.]